MSNSNNKKSKPKVKEICIKIIPHNEQRYETVGDYWKDENGIWQIRVSQTKSDAVSLLVALHELVEFILVDWSCISEEEITKFDIEFERKRKRGNNDEPGFDTNAPYKNEHAIATAVELIMCAKMNIPWKDYEKIINSL